MGKKEIVSVKKTMRSLIKHELDYEKTTAYFSDQLKDGNSLSQAILKDQKLKYGKFFTILPMNGKIDRLYEFSSGCIIPSLPTGIEKFHLLNKSDFQPGQIEVVSVNRFIYDFLENNDDNFALIENVLGKITDKYISISGVDIVLIGEEVYYLLRENCSLEQIKEACGKSQEAWHFLAVLGSHKSEINETVLRDGFDSIIQDIRYLIVGAYDEEGYIFWERTVK